MAVKKSKSKQKRLKPTKVDFVGYVQHNVSEADKEAFESWVEGKNFEYFWLALEREVDNGYKFSCKDDSYGGGVQASFLCSDPENQNAGLALVARAPDLWNATMLLLWKHVELFGGEWLDYYNQAPTRGEWG